MTHPPTTEPDEPKKSQEELLRFVTDPKTIAKAVEGSMDKRAAVLYPTTEAEGLREQITDLCFELGEANVKLTDALYEWHQLETAKAVRVASLKELQDALTLWSAGETKQHMLNRVAELQKGSE